MSKDDQTIPAKAGANKDVDAFLRKLALTPVAARPGGRGRLLFAMDATASREPTWDRACHIQAEMFTQTAALGGLNVQLVFYRGFRDCRSSPWLTGADDLLRFMSRVYCVGGMTQIGRLLQHAIKETKKRPVNAMVFVGDCMEEDPDRVCHLAGELGLLGVPCFVFQEGMEPAAMRTFKHIARLTNGAYCSFDAASAQTLRELLAAVAVYAAGGRPALENYSKKAGSDVLLLARQMK